MEDCEHAHGGVPHEVPLPLDVQPIVSIATLHSSNRKTGDILKIWILPRNLHPLDAVKHGEQAKSAVSFHNS